MICPPGRVPGSSRIAGAPCPHVQSQLLGMLCGGADGGVGTRQGMLAHSSECRGPYWDLLGLGTFLSSIG